MKGRQDVVGEINTQSAQIRKDTIENIRAYYMQHSKSVVDLPNSYPNVFIALTYVVTFIAGGIIL